MSEIPDNSGYLNPEQTPVNTALRLWPDNIAIFFWNDFNTNDCYEKWFSAESFQKIYERKITLRYDASLMRPQFTQTAGFFPGEVLRDQFVNVEYNEWEDYPKITLDPAPTMRKGGLLVQDPAGHEVSHEIDPYDPARVSILLEIPREEWMVDPPLAEVKVTYQPHDTFIAAGHTHITQGGFGNWAIWTYNEIGEIVDVIASENMSTWNNLGNVLWNHIERKVYVVLARLEAGRTQALSIRAYTLDGAMTEIPIPEATCERHFYRVFQWWDDGVADGEQPEDVEEDHIRVGWHILDGPAGPVQIPWQYLSQGNAWELIAHAINVLWGEKVDGGMDIALKVGPFGFNLAANPYKSWIRSLTYYHVTLWPVLGDRVPLQQRVEITIPDAYDGSLPDPMFEPYEGFPGAFWQEEIHHHRPTMEGDPPAEDPDNHSRDILMSDIRGECYPYNLLTCPQAGYALAPPQPAYTEKGFAMFDRFRSRVWSGYQASPGRMIVSDGTREFEIACDLVLGIAKGCIYCAVNDSDPLKVYDMESRDVPVESTSDTTGYPGRLCMVVPRSYFEFTLQ